MVENAPNDTNANPEVTRFMIQAHNFSFDTFRVHKDEYELTNQHRAYLKRRIRVDDACSDDAEGCEAGCDLRHANVGQARGRQREKTVLPDLFALLVAEALVL